MLEPPNKYSLSFLSCSDTPLVRILPKDRFSASSSFNDSVTAPNVRFPNEQQFGLSAPTEPWCPAKRDDWDYAQEYVIVDLGCQQTVRKLEGKDSHTLQYAVQYSNDEKIWKSLTSEDDTYYDKDLKVSVTTKAIIHPRPCPQVGVAAFDRCTVPKFHAHRAQTEEDGT